MKDLEGLRSIHYTHMAEPPMTSPIYEEVQTFRRELPRLLAEGNEGKWALVKGSDVVSIVESLEEGYRMGRERFLFEPFIVQPIREWQPLIQTTECWRHAALELQAQRGWNGATGDDRPERTRHSRACSDRESDPAAGSGPSAD